MALQKPDQIPKLPLSPQAIVERIDAIMQELQELRQSLVRAEPTSPENIVDELWGSLGQGSPDELVSYSDDVYLEMFNDEPADQ